MGDTTKGKSYKDYLKNEQPRQPKTQPRTEPKTEPRSIDEPMKFIAPAYELIPGGPTETYILKQNRKYKRT